MPGYNLFGAGAGLGLGLGMHLAAAQVAATGQLNAGTALNGGAEDAAAAMMGGATEQQTREGLLVGMQ